MSTWKHYKNIRGTCGYPLEQHIAWDLEDHDEKEHELIAEIYCVLSHSDA